MDFLENPLLTEDGFINQACINEMQQWIKNLPKPHERNTDPEWTNKRYTGIRQITSGLAKCAIRQIWCVSEDNGPAFPPSIEKVIGYLHSALRKYFDKLGYAKLSLNDISKMLYDTLYEQNISIFDSWNTRECLGDNWIDLDALLRNVCIDIIDERRKNDAFDAEFEAELKEK